MRKVLFLSILAFVVSGCAPKDSVEAYVPEPIKASPPLSSGKIKPELVGKWTTNKGMKSTITLNQDGTLTIASVVGTPGGAKNNNLTGNWSELDGKLLMETVSTENRKTSSFHPYTLKGDEMTLSSFSGKTVYKRS